MDPATRRVSHITRDSGGKKRAPQLGSDGRHMSSNHSQWPGQIWTMLADGCKITSYHAAQRVPKWSPQHKKFTPFTQTMRMHVQIRRTLRFSRSNAGIETVISKT